MNLDRVIAVRNDKTVYRDGDKCIKVFNSQYGKADVLSEAFNQARIEEIGVAVPKFISVSMIEDKWAITSEYVKGKTLARLLQENPEKKQDYLSFLVDLQVSVSEKTCENLNPLNYKLKVKLEKSDLDAEIKKELFSRLEILEEKQFVCHGDFNMTNVIIDENKKAYIIDWSHVTKGDACFDFSKTYLLLLLSEDVDGAETYLEMVYQKTKINKEAVLWWLPFACLSHLNKNGEQVRKILKDYIN